MYRSTLGLLLLSAPALGLAADGDRRPQLRLNYDRDITETGTLQASVALARFGAINNRDLDGDGTADGIDSGKPMIQARLGVTKLFDGLLSAGVWGHTAGRTSTEAWRAERSSRAAAWGPTFCFRSPKR